MKARPLPRPVARDGWPTMLICAAGASSRMRGRDKLMERVDGRVLLRQRAETVLEVAGGIVPVLVALPPGGTARAECLDGLDLARITVARPEEGLGVSISAGARAADPQRGLMVVLADMPEIDADDLAWVAETAASSPDTVVRGASRVVGRSGHPVVFPPRMLPVLARLRGAGAKAALQGEKVLTVPLPDCHALTDLDTPEAWAEWRARNPGRG